MKVTVIGLGRVGLVAAAELAFAGHEVLATDIDRVRLSQLKAGHSPFFEPGLPQRIASASRDGGLRILPMDDFHGSLGDIALVAAGTPAVQWDQVDLRGVRRAINWIKQNADGGLVVAMKSTVPPGTGMRLLEEELRGTGLGYAANPEFLREGQAVNDWEYPGRIVIGVASGDDLTTELVSRMYAGINAPVLVTGITSAEMIKYATNALLATRISFINEIASLCDALGASIDDVSDGLVLDPRTGSRIYAGLGYGGSCVPKDMEALNEFGKVVGLPNDLLRSVASVNERQRLLPLHSLRERFGDSLEGTRIGVLGLAFKPGTDDVRDAPALQLIRSLRADGFVVAAYDPRALKSARRELRNLSVRFCTAVQNACDQAQALVLVTEWLEIIDCDWPAVAQGMAPPRFIFDGRNALVPRAMNMMGFEYQGVERNSVGQAAPLGNAGNELAICKKSSDYRSSWVRWLQPHQGSARPGLRGNGS